MAVAQHMKSMELEGSLKAFKFPEILQFLAMGHMTGTLWLTQDDRQLSLVFKAGKIIGASSDERCTRLGQMLVYAGRISRQALEEALALQDGPYEGKRIGEILIDRGLLSTEELQSTLKLQLEEEIWDLFSWDNGHFRFEQGPVVESEFVTIALDVEPLLLEGSRRTDEWQAICSTISDPNEVFRVNPDLAGTPEEPLEYNTWKILSLVNGSLSVDAIVRLSNLGKFETYWALDQLLRSELIVSAGSSKSAEEWHKVERSTNGKTPVSNAETLNLGQFKNDDDDEKPSFLKLFGRKRPGMNDSQTTIVLPAAAGGDSGPRGGTEYFTDIGMICALMNHLIDRLTGDSKFMQPSDPADAISRMWFESVQRFPKADLVEWHRNRLSAERFERYVVAETTLSKHLLGAHDDALEALKMFWNKLRMRAVERLEEKGASAIIEKAMRPYLQCPPPKHHAGDFSLTRWQDAAA